ncbi:probable 2-methylcitrate dehydratase [Ustilago trichophora]|uniref:Probable 2-methylcitrate dehydratase n=1 Tax=Ustilago trichophora TaxID=86804 RepID=A0A5C3EAA1_9BASI|nr:probable 2-methylcitrate dehydratase [Ustilago trichophora]
MPRLVSQSTLAASLRSTSTRSISTSALPVLPLSLLVPSLSSPPRPSLLSFPEAPLSPLPLASWVDIADYVHNYKIDSQVAYDTARLCLLDSLGCAMEALRFPAAANLDPIRAAFNNGALIRWLDFNDTWLAAEWGHPSDNIGSILSVADWISRTNIANGKKPLTVEDVLTAAIQAHEIQGCLALENSFNRVGLDHVVLVKVASAAVVSKMIGNTRDQTVDVVSQAFVTASRSEPTVTLPTLARKGEQGYNSVLTAKTWGFYDVLFKGKEFKFQRPYGSYVMENVLFKLVPAEFHSQTAIEGAIVLHGRMQKNGKTSDDIKSVTIKTQEAAVRIISKSGKLNNYADRDHSLQYITAMGLINGKLDPEDYSDEVAKNPKIDELRAKMVTFNDGTTDSIALDYPVGHARRRDEAKPLIKAKLQKHLKGFFPEARQSEIVALLEDHEKLTKLPANEFVDLWVRNQ